MIMVLLILRHLIGFSEKNRFERSFVRLRNGGSLSPIIPSEGQGEPIQDQREDTPKIEHLHYLSKLYPIEEV